MFIISYSYFKDLYETDINTYYLTIALLLVKDTFVSLISTMGIPVYFKTLISDYGDTILHKDKYDDINHLFLI